MSDFIKDSMNLWHRLMYPRSHAKRVVKAGDELWRVSIGDNTVAISGPLPWSRWSEQATISTMSHIWYAGGIAFLWVSPRHTMPESRQVTGWGLESLLRSANMSLGSGAFASGWRPPYIPPPMPNTAGKVFAQWTSHCNPGSSTTVRLVERVSGQANPRVAVLLQSEHPHPRFRT